MSLQLQIKIRCGRSVVMENYIQFKLIPLLLLVTLGAATSNKREVSYNVVEEEQNILGIIGAELAAKSMQECALGWVDQMAPTSSALSKSILWLCTLLTCSNCVYFRALSNQWDGAVMKSSFKVPINLYHFCLFWIWATCQKNVAINEMWPFEKKLSKSLFSSWCFQQDGYK